MVLSGVFQAELGVMAPAESTWNRWSPCRCSSSTTSGWASYRVTAAEDLLENCPSLDRVLLLEDTSETSANVGIGDLNGDGYLDIVLVSSFPWKRRIQNTNVGVAGVLVCQGFCGGDSDGAGRGD